MEIRIYVEGGGDRDSKGRLRFGFKQFFSHADPKASEWNVIACGSREEALQNFLLAHKSHPRAFNVLLVDSEAPVNLPPKGHLALNDGWDLTRFSDEQVHLMVQMMEAWLVADPETLRDFYGQHFAGNALPRNPNVEAISKVEIEQGLKRATRKTSKGEYHKTRHAPELLKRLNATKVRYASKQHCERFFTILLKKTG